MFRSSHPLWDSQSYHRQEGQMGGLHAGKAKAAAANESSEFDDAPSMMKLQQREVASRVVKALQMRSRLLSDGCCARHCYHEIKKAGLTTTLVPSYRRRRKGEICGCPYNPTIVKTHELLHLHHRIHGGWLLLPSSDLHCWSSST